MPTPKTRRVDDEAVGELRGERVHGGAEKVQNEAPTAAARTPEKKLQRRPRHGGAHRLRSPIS